MRRSVIALVVVAIVSWQVDMSVEAGIAASRSRRPVFRPSTQKAFAPPANSCPVGQPCPLQQSTPPTTVRPTTPAK